MITGKGLFVMFRQGEEVEPPTPPLGVAVESRVVDMAVERKRPDAETFEAVYPGKMAVVSEADPSPPSWSSHEVRRSDISCFWPSGGTMCF